ELCEKDTAIHYYQKAIESDPDNYQPYKNMGLTYIDKNDWKKAHKYFSKSVELRYDKNIVNSNEDVIVGKHKLKHDIEQLEYLIENKLLNSEFRKEIDNYREVYHEISTKYPDSFLINLKENLASKIRKTFDKNIYTLKNTYIENELFSNKNNYQEIEEKYLNLETQVIYFDEFLTPETLKMVQDFCNESTIWHEFRRNRGYLASYMDNGLSTEVLYQISDELRKKMPKIFDNLYLMNIWAFKYDSKMDGVLVHADEAIVNVNFWIAPEDANLDKSSGGLIVYDVKAPIDWSFEKYNADTNYIYSYLSKNNANKIVIPHKENRAVLFDSSLFHETDKFNFKEGYENRRINVTLLFGKRE
ncbi:MAG: tetratricopeptide repeat protein, partial [Candidatus Sericytochromatia bacterium]